MQAEVRERLGNFILGEDDQTLEGVVLAELTREGATLALVETFTSGQIAARFGHLPGAEHVLRAGITVRDRTALHKTLDLSQIQLAGDLSEETTAAVAQAARPHRRDPCAGGADRADDGPDRIDFGGTIWLAIATAEDTAVRRSRILGGREWVRLARSNLD